MFCTERGWIIVYSALNIAQRQGRTSALVNTSPYMFKRSWLYSIL